MDKILNREEINERYKWKLEDIFESEEEWNKGRKKIEKLLSEMDPLIINMTDSASNLLAYMKLSDDLGLIAGKVFIYAHLKQDENTRDSKRQELGQKLTNLGLEYSKLGSIFSIKIMELDETKLGNFYQEEKELLFYKKVFDGFRRYKPHTLTEAEELILSQTGLLTSSSTIYDMLNDADLTFPVVQDKDGNTFELTQGNFTSLMENKDQQFRKQVFEKFYSSFKQFKNSFAATLNGSVKEDMFYSSVHKHSSSLEAALFDDNIPTNVYTNLIEAVRNKVDSMEKYIVLRKKMLGLDELHMYDLYVPLVNELDIKIPYKEAYKTVKEALSVFGREYADILEEAYQNNWIDVYENVGKRSGAYQIGVYGVHPFVLLNHKDNNLNSMFTISHEMGHSLHTVFSSRENKQIYAVYSIFVAEVASIVNEILLMKYLLKITNDKNMKVFLLTYYLDQFRTTLFRQTMFAEFEKIIHERVENGEPLTADAISDIYYQLNRDYYGQEIKLDPEIALEWARIPHFYNAFYVFQYATGFSAATALASQILEEGEPAVKRYLDFLKSGGTDYPIELLKKAGVDMSSPKPVEQALRLFEELTNELESLI